jgi:5'(3')-deoxyribonucleotidase
LAADMANSICDMIDTVMNGMQHVKAIEALKLVEKEYFTLKADVEKMQDSLNYYRSLGIVDYNSQVEMLTEAYGEAVVQNNKEGAKKLQEKLDMLAKYGGLMPILPIILPMKQTIELFKIKIC